MQLGGAVKHALIGLLLHHYKINFILNHKQKAYNAIGNSKGI